MSRCRSVGVSRCNERPPPDSAKPIARPNRESYRSDAREAISGCRTDIESRGHMTPDRTDPPSRGWRDPGPAVRPAANDDQPAWCSSRLVDAGKVDHTDDSLLTLLWIVIRVFPLRGGSAACEVALSRCRGQGSVGCNRTGRTPDRDNEQQSSAKPEYGAPWRWALGTTLDQGPIQDCS